MGKSIREGKKTGLDGGVKGKVPVSRGTSRLKGEGERERYWGRSANVFSITSLTRKSKSHETSFLRIRKGNYQQGKSPSSRFSGGNLTKGTWAEG